MVTELMRELFRTSKTFLLHFASLKLCMLGNVQLISTCKELQFGIKVFELTVLWELLEITLYIVFCDVIQSLWVPLRVVVLVNEERSNT